jgi:hypothetical protein
LLGETPYKAFAKEAPAPASPVLPEPPVVVYVKEAGESSI